MEFKTRGADWLYQIFKRLHRSNDPWTKCLIGWTCFSWLMFHQALIWKLHFVFFGCTAYTRIRDRGSEPSVDEIYILDTIFKNERLSKLFSPTTYHIIDYNQEFEDGFDNPYFPEYKTQLAKFFNTDPNTTLGIYKLGDVETGATMTLQFRTMPFSNNKYNFTEPFLIYDLWAEVHHDGKYFEEHIIKAEEVLKTKKIFVTLH